VSKLFSNQLEMGGKVILFFDKGKGFRLKFSGVGLS